MLDQESKDALRAILSQDKRPWTRVVDGRDEYIAELQFRRSEGDDARRLADEARELGFEVVQAERLALSESAATEAYQFLSLLITSGAATAGAVVLVNSALKAAHELPENWRKLRDRLRPHMTRAIELAPALQLELVHRWLDAKYGAKCWSYDPDLVEAKPIANVTVFILQETISESRHLLAVSGNDVEELPNNWLPPSE